MDLQPDAFISLDPKASGFKSSTHYEEIRYFDKTNPDEPVKIVTYSPGGNIYSAIEGQ
jgi:hypothetical protein